MNVSAGPSHCAEPQSEHERQDELRGDRVRRRLPLRVDLGERRRQDAASAHAVPHAGGDVLAGQARADHRREHREQGEPPQAPPEPVWQHQRRELLGRGQVVQVLRPPADDLAPDHEHEHDADDHDRCHGRAGHVPTRVLGLLRQRDRGLPAGQSLHREHDGEREPGRRGDVTRVEAVREGLEREAPRPRVAQAPQSERQHDEKLGIAPTTTIVSIESAIPEISDQPR